MQHTKRIVYSDKPCGIAVWISIYNGSVPPVRHGDLMSHWNRVFCPCPFAAGELEVPGAVKIQVRVFGHMPKMCFSTVQQKPACNVSLFSSPHCCIIDEQTIYHYHYQFIINLKLTNCLHIMWQITTFARDFKYSSHSGLIHENIHVKC